MPKETEPKTTAEARPGESGFQEILAGLLDILRDDLGIEVDEPADSAMTLEDLGVDSLMLVEFAVAAEERFSVSLPDGDIHMLRTLEDTVRVVERLRAAPEEDPGEDPAVRPAETAP